MLYEKANLIGGEKVKNFLNKRICGIPMIAILAISLCIGSATAIWISGFYMRGTVQTSEFNGIVKLEYSLDPPGKNDPYFTGGGIGQRNFDQATTDIRVDGNTVIFTVKDAYPDYVAGGVFTLRNVGNVPLKVTNLIYTGDPQLKPLIEGISNDTLVNPGADPVKFIIAVHVTPEIIPGGTYTFEVVLNLVYNQNGW